MLEIGSKAPEFSLSDQNGEVHTLSDYKGKKRLLKRLIMKSCTETLIGWQRSEGISRHCRRTADDDMLFYGNRKLPICS